MYRMRVYKRAEEWYVDICRVTLTGVRYTVACLAWHVRWADAVKHALEVASAD